MRKNRLPVSVRQFVEQQETVAVADYWKDDPDEVRSPYGSYWYRAVNCMLLSGRVNPKASGYPNRTEANRVGKEANFNQYLIERIGQVLVAADVLVPNRSENQYVEGPNQAAFWDRDWPNLQEAGRLAALQLTQKPPEYYSYHRHTRPPQPHRLTFLTLFLASFQGRALRESAVSGTAQALCTLPKKDLVTAAEALELDASSVRPDDWRRWLGEEGKQFLLSGLYTAEWAYYATRDKKERDAWVFASPVGLAMLGLAQPPPAPELAPVFKVQADLSIFAGAGLALDKLVPLFRHTKIQRIDEVYEFRLDRTRLAQAPSASHPGEELRSALQELEPVPPTVADALGTTSRLGGVIRIRGCSAVVKPESADMLQAIRQHARLKNYLEPKAPPGYLLLKSESDPFHFIERCRELGFDVQSL